ncbi:hypothetical protein HN51_012505 [Arachis hypogaea]|uniref:Phytocyanin domain-containing protein n=1 Tax=Arachis hypogaea TaxID=3818 RepID=A0A445DU55_ARAHY|nr:Mavicyanin [Arachis hypogaea]RYR66728.1 hypothetical protein Ahy_A03g012790 [Arachis hypogaea]
MDYEKVHLSLLISTMISYLTLECVSSKTTHIVGDRVGWASPGYNGFYENWSKNVTFNVGDVLLFQYNPGLSTVVHVNKDDYDHCTTRNVMQTYFRGNSSITLDHPGEYFFFCSVGKHCEAGQKLQISVSQGNPPSKTS